MRVFAALLLTLALAGCDTPSGERAAGFVNDAIARAYIPIEGRTLLIRPNAAAGVVIAPGIGVTNAHVGEFLGKRPVIGTSRNYDLMYFGVASQQAPMSAAPSLGERVIAYGQDLSGTLRVAQGVVRGLNMPVKPRCGTCAVQSSFIFEGNAGPGFSGGPVVDAATGRLVGITFGYDDDAKGHRLMYAYPMSRVHNELATIQGRLPADVE